MAELVTFVPKSQCDASKNLKEFIRLCRDDLTLFDEVDGFRWRSYEWPKFNLAKLSNGRRGVTPAFHLDDSFVDFARAYYRYRQSHNPTIIKSERYALIALEAALVDRYGSGDLENISKDVLDHAAQLASEKYSVGVAYRTGRELRAIACFLSENMMVTAHIEDWRSPIRRQNDRRNTGTDGRRAIESRLPSDEAIHAMAEMFSNDPVDTQTIFATSVFALLLGTGFRIGELFDLKIDAEVRQLTDDGQVRYGLRYEGEKGWGSDIKWVEKTYTDVCREAFRRLLKLSEAGRAFASHMESQPLVPYMWPGLNIDNLDRRLTRPELSEIFGVGYYHLGIRTGDSYRDCHEKVALQRLPTGFPDLPKATGASPSMRWSESLFCYRSNELHARRSVTEGSVWRPTANTLNHALGPRPGVNHHLSIFERHGYHMPDGSAMKISSHQARHFLSTVAERGGMAQDEIARFFGRADMRHNRTYNHMSDAELVAKSQSLNQDMQLFGADEQVRMRLPVSSLEFNALVDLVPVHSTEYGFCVHDYTMSPCEKFRDCINCTEQVCVKGNEEKLARLRIRLDIEGRQVKAHLRAMEEGKVGANRWYEHAEKTIARLKELIAILESAQVEDGAAVRLRGADEHSHLGRALAMRGSEVDQLDKQDEVEKRAIGLLSQYELLVGEK